jgi:hypothetical protein
MDKNIDDLFRLAQQYNPQQVGIEVTGQQGGFIPWIMNEMVNRNIYFPLASEGNNAKPGIRPNTNKLQRFNIVVPWFKSGKIWFPEEKKTSPELMEMMDELSLVAPTGFRSKHDDFSDTISQLASLKPWKPSQVSTKEDESGRSIWDDEIDKDDHCGNINSYIV